MRAVVGGDELIAGRYRLGRPIGRGATGVVWLGRDELLARDVAVKEIQISAQATPAAAELAYQGTLREARAAASLSHPGAVTVFDVVEENGRPWIVMELVKGRALDRVIIEDGPLPPRQAAELGSSLIGALAAAHSAGVLHRDVKPGNVLVCSDGRAVLTDFGIATFAGEPSQAQAGMVVGTPGFTAPERVRGGGATPASDLWSLGATLYAAVEGRGPFQRAGGADAVTLRVATDEAPIAPSAGQLGPVIDSLLRRDPAARPDAATAARLLAEAVAAPADMPSVPAALEPPVFATLSMPELPDLAGAGGDGPARGRPGDGGLRNGRQGAPWRGRRRRLLTGAGIAAIAAAVIVAWYLYNGAGASQADQHPTARSTLAVGGSSPQGPVPRPGYVWHRFTASMMGTAAGFEIAMPSGWRQSITAQTAHMNDSTNDFHLTVNLAPWTLAGPLAEADHLANLAAKTDAGDRQLSLGPVGFKAVGGFTAARAARLRFRWTQMSKGSVTELVILVTLATEAGRQPYTFTLTAPAARFESASGIFYAAIPTFRPLPG